MHTMSEISFSIASMIESAAKGGGTYTTEASGLVSRTACYNASMTAYAEQLIRLASLTLPNTGRPRCVWPALLGETPPTILVP